MLLSVLVALLSFAGLRGFLCQAKSDLLSILSHFPQFFFDSSLNLPPYNSSDGLTMLFLLPALFCTSHTENSSWNDTMISLYTIVIIFIFVITIIIIMIMNFHDY